MLQQATDRGVQLSNQEAETMVKYFDRQLKQKSPKSQNDIDRAFDVARETVREMRIVALQSKKEALLRAKHRANITAAISKSANEIDGYNAYLTGNSKMTVGSRDSVSSLKGAIHKDYAASFELDLNKKGAHLEDVFRRGTLDEEITMYAYTSPDNRGQMVSDGKVSKVVQTGLNGGQEAVWLYNSQTDTFTGIRYSFDNGNFFTYHYEFDKGNIVSEYSGVGGTAGSSSSQKHYDSFINPHYLLGITDYFLRESSKNNVNGETQSYAGSFPIYVPGQYTYTYQSGYPMEKQVKYVGYQNPTATYTSKTVYEYEN